MDKICPCGKKFFISAPSKFDRKKYCCKKCFYQYHPRRSGLVYKLVKKNPTSFRKGFTPWNKNKKGVQKSHRKGKTYVEVYGKKRAKLIIRKISKNTKKAMKTVPCEKLANRKGIKNPELSKKLKGLVGNKSRAWKGGRSYIHKEKYQEVIAGRKRPTKCDVCRVSVKNLGKRLCFDHDHNTGKFRGWLCMHCNLALGMVDDRIEILESLINYLRKTK